MQELHSDKRGLLRVLRISSAAYFFIVLLWIVLMASAAYSGTVEEKLAALRADILPHILNFANASIIAFPFSAMMIALALLPAGTPRLRHVMGILFLAPYIVLVSIAYTSQYTYFPLLLNSGSPAAVDWFFDNPLSAVYFLDQLGYFFLALSGFLIGFDYITSRGLKMLAGINIYLISSFSVAAFVLFAANPETGGMASVISGALTAPLAAILFLFANKSLNTKD